MTQNDLLSTFFLVVAAGYSSFATAASPPVNATTYNYYVAPNGSDGNPGTVDMPFQTILRASKVALPGTTVHVAPGVYSGGFKTSMSGTAEQRIYYVSTVRWGAKLVPPMSSESRAAWDNRGNYVDIVGFEIDGSATRNGTKWTHGIYNGGSYAIIKYNLVHHIALDTPCNGAGAAGISIDSYFRGVKIDVVGNTVHHVGKVGCRFVKGIHISTSGSARNNLVHNIGGAAIQMWHDANNVTVSNNTVARSMIGILVGGGDFYHTKGPNDFTAVYNNIVYDNKYGISEQGATGVHNTYRNNLVFQSKVSDWRLLNGLVHTGTVAKAPQFVQYGKKGSFDFRLRCDSPAIGKGLDDQAGDAGGKARAKPPLVVDIGAYQFK